MSDYGLVWWLGQHLLITTTLAAIVYLVCRALKLSPAARHVLWLLVLCRLMMPPVATWPWSLSIAAMYEAGTPHVASARTSQVDTDAIATERGATSTVVSMTDTVPFGGEFSDGNHPDARDSAESAGRTTDSAGLRPDGLAMGTETTLDLIPIPWLIASLWAIATVAAAITLAHRIRRVGRLLQSDAEVEAWLKSDVAQWCHRLGIHPPDCVVTGAVGAPLLWCLGRVRLVWPLTESHVERRRQARPILVHELAHLRRRDHWTAWAEVVGMTVWWWNPVFWFVRRQLRAAAEMACDAWVVELLPDRRREYAESLVEFSRRGRSIQWAVGAVGAGSGSRRTFTRRLEMIMNDSAATRFSKWTIAAAVLLAALSLPTFAIEPQAQQADSEDADPNSPVTADMLEESSRVSGENQRAESNAEGRNRSTNFDYRIVETTENRTVQSVRNESGGEYDDSGAESLNEVLRHIEEKYYGGVDRRELERVAIEAILAKLDNRSSLLTPEAYKQLQVSVDGNLVGVGIAIHLDSETKLPVVTRAIRNSPGQAAGLRRHDVILSIDGASTAGLGLQELVDRIRGPRGSTVKLGIQRADEKLDVQVVRERFETSVVNPLSVSPEGRENYWADREAGIGYVHIPAFTKHTASQLRKVLVALGNQGLKGLVLDLRDCGGGLLSAAIEVVDMFIDEGTILSSQGRSEAENVTFRAKAGGEYLDLPLAVLTNGHTASAAEIVAAALQDHHRAATIGEQTYGRGTVQAIFQLKDGSALRLTTAAWLRPNGRTLVRREGRDDWGVQPDAGRIVAVTEEAHNQLAKQREAQLNGEKVETPTEDVQLNKAMAVLRPD